MAVTGSFIIHLDRATERARQVARLREALPGPVEVVPADDARAAPAEASRAVRGPLFAPRWPFGLNPTEIAVFLSHRRAWARIVESGFDAGFVVEDDVDLGPAFGAAWDLALAHADPGAVTRFPWKDRERPGAVIAETGGARLIRPRTVALGMQATLIGRDAAARLLEATETFDRPVDVALQAVWATGVEMRAVRPSGVRDVSAGLGGSTLKKRDRGMSRLRAELARARYRAAVAVRSRF